MYPSKPFESLEKARKWVDQFVKWYNTKHLHSGIKFVTPEQRHKGRDEEILKQREEVYQKAREKNPHRWSQGIRNWKKDYKVLLNPKKVKVRLTLCRWRSNKNNLCDNYAENHRNLEGFCMKTFSQTDHQTSDQQIQKSDCVCQIFKTDSYDLVPKSAKQIFGKMDSEGSLPWFTKTSNSKASSTQISCKDPNDYEYDL